VTEGSMQWWRTCRT